MTHRSTRAGLDGVTRGRRRDRRGVGFVMVFIPVIFAMMLSITFLEGSGYMARAAFALGVVLL